MHYTNPYLALLGATGLASSSSVLFAGGTIIAFDPAANDLDVIRNGTLFINEDRIAGIWPSGTTPNITVPDNAEIIDATGKILTPGFVDIHRHGWQTLYRTLLSNLTISTYLSRYGEYAAAGYIDAEQVYISQLEGLYEALDAGTTTSLDHAHHTWSDDTAYAGLKGSIDSGARVFWSYAFHEVANYTVAQQVANFREISKAAPFKDTPVSLGIACDLFDTTGFGGSVDLQSIKSIFDMALELDVSVITAHSSGGPYGLDNTPSALHELGMLNISIPVVFSHATHITHKDHTLLRSTNQHIAVTPGTEMSMAIGFPHSDSILDQAGLGVDSHGLVATDMVAQARLWMQATRLKLNDQLIQNWQLPASTPMSVVQAFLLATRNGGLALRRPDLGVLNVGAKADVVVWDGTAPGMIGWLDPVAAIILHSNPSHVEHVLVDGRFVKRDFRLVAEDYSQVKARYLEAAKRVHDT